MLRASEDCRARAQPRSLGGRRSGDRSVRYILFVVVYSGKVLVSHPAHQFLCVQRTFRFTRPDMYPISADSNVSASEATKASPSPTESKTEAPGSILPTTEATESSHTELERSMELIVHITTPDSGRSDRTKVSMGLTRLSAREISWTSGTKTTRPERMAPLSRALLKSSELMSARNSTNS